MILLWGATWANWTRATRKLGNIFLISACAWAEFVQPKLNSVQSWIGLSRQTEPKFITYMSVCVILWLRLSHSKPFSFCYFILYSILFKEVDPLQLFPPLNWPTSSSPLSLSLSKHHQIYRQTSLQVAWDNLQHFRVFHKEKPTKLSKLLVPSFLWVHNSLPLFYRMTFDLEVVNQDHILLCYL